MICSRASVPIAENMSANFVTCSGEYRCCIFRYLQKYRLTSREKLTRIPTTSHHGSPVTRCRLRPSYKIALNRRLLPTCYQFDSVETDLLIAKRDRTLRYNARSDGL